jgi:HSP20 family protein
MSLREMMDQLLSEAFIMPRPRAGSGAAAQAAPGGLTPPVNMYETSEELVVVLPVPGASPNDIQVDLLGTQLSIRTTARRDEPHPNVGGAGGAPGPGEQRRHDYLHEFQIGPYARTIELPYAVNADQARSQYEHGILVLRFPCPQANVPRRIAVQHG